MQFRVRTGEPDDRARYARSGCGCFRRSRTHTRPASRLKPGFRSLGGRERVTHPMLLLAVNLDDEVVGTATGVARPDGTVEVVAMYVGAGGPWSRMR